MYRAQSSYKFIFSIMVLNLCLLTYTSFFKILELYRDYSYKLHTYKARLK